MLAGPGVSQQLSVCRLRASEAAAAPGEETHGLTDGRTDGRKEVKASG